MRFYTERFSEKSNNRSRENVHPRPSLPIMVSHQQLVLLDKAHPAISIVFLSGGQHRSSFV